MPKNSNTDPKPQCVQTDVSISFLSANALCLDCGITKENPENGFCTNGHDNWLEMDDEAERFSIACKKFKVDMPTIINSIKTNTDLYEKIS